MQFKFKAWDYNEGKFITIRKINAVDALYWAWNYEFDVYDIITGKLVFSPWESNEFNSELLSKYGLRLIDHGKYRVFQSIENDEIYPAPWETE